MEWDSISPVIIIIIIQCSDLVVMLQEVHAAGIIGHPLTTALLNFPIAAWMESDIISPVIIIIIIP